MTRISAACAAAMLFLPACAGTTPAPAPPVPAACATGDAALERDELYFGRNRKGGAEVSEEEWQGFLGGVVTPRFPAGFTVWEARGQWRGADGTVEVEKSKVLAVFHPPDGASRAAVDTIVALYRADFQQEAVLRARTPACVGFGTTR